MTQISDETRRDIINQLRVAIDWALDAEGDPHVPSAKPAVLAMTAAIGALTAALGAAPAAEAVTGRDEWQPIETAPRDGTLIDVWCIRPPHEAEERDHEIRLTDISWCDTRWGRITDTGMLDLVEEGACDESGFPPWVPTHWRPLPAPPATIPAPRPVVAEVAAEVQKP